MKYLVVFSLLAVFRLSLFAAEKGSAEDYIARAEAAFGKNAFKKTISLCDKALDRDPQAAKAYFWKARALELLKKPMESANEYRAAILAGDDFQEAREGLARVNLELDTAKGKESSSEFSNE